MKALIILIWMCIVLSVPFSCISDPIQDSKARVRLGLDYFKTPEREYLSVKVSGRLERRYEPIESIGISFYRGKEQSDENFLGRILTDHLGTGTFLLSKLQPESAEELIEFNFLAVLDQSEIYEDKSTDLTIRKIKFEIDLLEEDSLKQATVYIAEKDSLGNDLPIGKVPVKFYVERPLGRLPVGEEFNMTNGEGNVTVVYTVPSDENRWASLHDIEFPYDLPGDQEGLLNIIAKIDDHDEYGTIEENLVLPWGVPTMISDETTARTLWASGANVPILLLMLVNGLILTVWGIIFYIIYKIYVISRI